MKMCEQLHVPLPPATASRSEPTSPPSGEGWGLELRWVGGCPRRSRHVVRFGPSLAAAVVGGRRRASSLARGDGRLAAAVATPGCIAGTEGTDELRQEPHP